MEITSNNGKLKLRSLDLKKAKFAAAISFFLFHWFVLPTQALDEDNASILHVENGKLSVGGPIKSRLFLQKFYDKESKDCANEEINIKISAGRVTYNFNTGDKVRTHRRQTKSEAYSDLQVGNEGCVIRILISRPPTTERCTYNKCS